MDIYWEDILLLCFLEANYTVCNMEGYTSFINM